MHAAPRLIAKPDGREQIRALIIAAEAMRPPLRVRAVGAGWSFSTAAATDGQLLDLRGCVQPLTDIIDSPYLVHVEAGMTLWALHHLLELRGRALAAIPGGSGQTLGGALCTATHGADVHLPPLADAVRAVHLIGPGGAEHWIDGDPPCVDPARVTAAYPGIRAISDDDALRAVTVSAGRFGVLYSAVLDTVPAYSLRETRTTRTWPDIADQLADPGFRGRHRAIQVLIDPYPRPGTARRAWLTTRAEVRAGRDAPAHPDAQTAPTTGPGASARIAGQIKIVPPMLTVPGMRSGRAGSVFIAVCRTANRAGRPGITRALVRATLGAAQRDRTVDDIAYRLAAGPPDAFESCRGSSLEMFFDADSSHLRLFIDDVLLPTVATIGQCDPVPCWIAIRLTGASHALLAMQRWRTTACVEVAVLRGARRGPELLTTLETLAVRAGATIHWGQWNNLHAADIAAMFPHLSDWRRQLKALTPPGGEMTFANTYCSQRGLDPDT